ncbi:MAG TPA: phosphatidate cytidylyltransferase [Candidatus Cloacimonas acidaminovorans]|mgnify:FL=1|nr:phosphatidate cytidylyltransferase [Candidatus Cloacimonas acidaminovorans]
MSELAKRVLVAVILIPIVLIVLYYRGLPLVITLLIITFLSSWEYAQMLNKAGIKIYYVWLAFNSLLYLAFVYMKGKDLSLLWLVLFLAIGEAILTWEKELSVPRIFAVLFGFVYTALFPALIARLGLYYAEHNFLLALILLIWIVDSVAYFAGIKIGKHRNITAISPQKSLEGFIAGVLAPWLILIILYICKVEILPFSYLALLAVASGIFGQIGDLAESMLKRFCKVKNSSNLLPGHGGILDRCDSCLFAGSFLYCALEILTKVR